MWKVISTILIRNFRNLLRFKLKAGILARDWLEKGHLEVSNTLIPKINIKISNFEAINSY